MRSGAAAWQVIACLVVLTGALGATAARADPTTTRTTIHADAVGRAAPNGIMLMAGLLRRWGIDDGDSPLLRGRYLELGGSVGLNPAYTQAGVHGEWVPIALVQLRVQYDLYAFFGANGALLSFPSASSPFGDAQIKARSGSETTGLGHRFLLAPVLRVRVAPIVLRSETTVAWFALSSTGGWFYESEYDTLLAQSDVVVSNRSTLFLELWHGAGEATLLLGPGYEVTHAARADITRQRAEGVLLWLPADAVGSFARPRIFVVAGVNLVDRNRQGDPFAIAGVGADLDL